VDKKDRKKLKAEVKTRFSKVKDRLLFPLRVRQRFFEGMKRFHESIVSFAEEYETKRGVHWSVPALLDLVYQGVSYLRSDIENPEIEAVSWASPFIEVRHPVLWDWENGALPPLYFEPEDFTDEKLREYKKNEEEFLGKFVETTGSVLSVTALLLLTNGTVYFKRGQEYSVSALRNFAPDPPEGLTDEEKAAKLEELARPFVFSKPGDGLEGSGTCNGKPFTFSLVVEFHPLVVDLDEERAFLPVLVGLDMEGEGGDASLWPEEDRAELWKGLLEGLEEAYGRMGSKAEEAGEPAPAAQTVPVHILDYRGPRETAPSPKDSPVVTVPPPERSPLERGTFPVAFGRALGDGKALALLNHLHPVRLPAKRWSSLRSWPDLVEAEVQRIRDEEGEDAFEDLRQKTGNSKARGPLLSRRFRAGGHEVVELTAEAEKRLKIREGLGTGLRYLDPTTGAEYFLRLFQVGGGYLEVGLSWYGMAGPWVEEWRKLQGQETEDLSRGGRQELLFEDLEEKRRERVELAVRRFQGLEDGRKIMELALGQVGRQAQNPARIPAVVFRELLGLHHEKDWRARIKEGLEALRSCSFRVTSFDTEKVEGYGSFLSSWWYYGAGGGAHGEGDYFLNVETAFLGCLSVFESGRRKLSSNKELVQYDFGKKPTAEEKKDLGWGRRGKKEKGGPVSTFVPFDAGRVFYNAQAGLTPAQTRLVAFLEKELTLRKDGVSTTLGDHKTRKASQAKPTATDANEPRLYGRDFCPLLPEGKLFHGALGHFFHHAEAGRSLYGTQTRSTATGGQHTDGLLSVLGYYLPPGSAYAERGRLVRQAFEDLQAVVVDYLGGVVAARGPEGRWLTLEDAAKLPETDLGRRTKWFLFLPETWGEDRRRKWEKASRWTATEDPAEAARAREALLARTLEAPKAETGLDLLRHRLRAARLNRNLSFEDVGRLFGVSKVTVYRWELGPEPDLDEGGKVKGDRIPPERVPLVARWVETGEVPTVEELASLKTRRQGVNPETGKPWRERNEGET